MTSRDFLQRARLPLFLLTLGLAACAAAVRPAEAGQAPWPPSWQDEPASANDEFTPPSFDAPSATHCHRLPKVNEVPGGGGSQSATVRRGRASEAEKRSSRDEASDLAMAESAPAPVPSPPTAATGDARVAPKAFAPMPVPTPEPQPAAQERVTAGMVDDNADFGAYLGYRKRNVGLAVRDRDVSERYLLEVTDANGRPVHDAEVAVQGAGIAEPLMWARTDAGGRVWLHPRAFLRTTVDGEPALRVAARKGASVGTAPLVRGQAQAVQVRLGGQVVATPARLDLVFLVDATGSMDDEIAKLKSSMRAMAQQISQLPGRPDICYGLVPTATAAMPS